MGIFFDQDWFDDRLKAAGLTHAAMAQATGMTIDEVDLVFRDQRELGSLEVHAIARILSADPREVAATFDPTGERSGLDWLYPLQDAFWHQLELVDPEAYIASGGSDIVVSTNRAFVDRFLELARGTMT